MWPTGSYRLSVRWRSCPPNRELALFERGLKRFSSPHVNPCSLYRKCAFALTATGWCKCVYRVLHRDLKAGNVFLTSRNLVKVGDFGISKVLDSTAQLARTTIGTPYYLAPELINGEAYDFKADVWALGVLLYEMMALRRPFEADSLPALAMRIVRVEYSPAPESYSAELRSLLGAMLQRDPAARPSCAQIASSPFVRRHHARLQAELRALSLAVLPTPTERKPTSATPPPLLSSSQHQQQLSSTPPGEPSGAMPCGQEHGQEARAAACAIRTLASSAPAESLESFESNMRFSQNLHALELNLAEKAVLSAHLLNSTFIAVSRF